MKVLCVVPSYWPAFKFGGPIYSLHVLNKALVKKGVDVTVYTTNVGLGGGVPVNGEVHVDGIKVNYFVFTEFLEFLGATGWQFSLPMTRALKKNLKTFDIVYIVAVWNYPIGVAAHFCRQYKSPYILSPRGLLYPYITRKKFWKKLPYYYLAARRDLKGASAIHYTTEDEAEKCHPSLSLKNPAIVIPNGVDLSEFKEISAKGMLRERYPLLKDKKVILFLGRISWKKGLDILIKAYAMLSRERDDVHLLIAGNDEEGYGKEVKKTIKDFGMNYLDYGLGDKGLVDREPVRKRPEEDNSVKVTFTGMLTEKERLEAFGDSDIFVLPSYSENFGMSVVEAMACGVPTVVSDKVGIYKEIEQNKAGVVVETNPGSLSRGIKILLDNEGLRKEIAENGRGLVKGYYDIDTVADMMIKAYEEIVRNGKRDHHGIRLE